MFENRGIVGSLLYLTHTRPDISFVVGLGTRYMQTPHESHWKAAKSILRYVHGTVQFGIHYNLGGTPLLVGFTDSDWADGPDDQKSTVGYVFNLSSGPVTGIPALGKKNSYSNTMFNNSGIPTEEEHL
jgi:hypothetical protein